MDRNSRKKDNRKKEKQFDDVMHAARRMGSMIFKIHKALHKQRLRMLEWPQQRKKDRK